jgi:hypothetical protein
VKQPAVWVTLFAATLAGALVAASGLSALPYTIVYAAAVAPGVLFAGRLVSPAPAAAIVGAVIGYGFSQLALWLPIFLRIPSLVTFAAVWLAGATASIVVARRVAKPVLMLRPWTPADTRGLMLAAILVPLVMWPPYRNLGAADHAGTRYYRAYFTADFVWHTALATELGRYDSPPRNPYMSSVDLHYYWTYFLLPAVVAQEAPRLIDVERALKANAILSGVLLAGMLFLVVREATPSPGVAATAVALGALAASAEGTFVLQQLWRSGTPLAAVENMNIDAITSWQFGGLRVDNLPRSLWYTPQHAFSTALGLIAVTVAATSGARAATGAVWTAGVALALSTCFNPLLGGMFAMIYGLAVGIEALSGRGAMWTLARHAQAAVPVALALGWTALNDVADGAGSAVAFGFRGFARNNTLTSLLLSTGPVLVPAVAGLWPWRSLPAAPARVAAIGAVVALLLMHFVTLSDPSWVGFRAGQLLLLMLPVLLARVLWVLGQQGLPWAAGAAALILMVGLPTTLIDTYNAMDISNRRQGPGFLWTLAVTPQQQAAFAWVKDHTAADATLQMEPILRGRGHWSLIPTFAGRRMTAGLPISLLPTPAYEQGSREVQEIFRTANPRTAWQLARARGIDYLYVDGDDRRAYPDGVAKFSGAYFTGVYDNGEVSIIQIRK